MTKISESNRTLLKILARQVEHLAKGEITDSAELEYINNIIGDLEDVRTSLWPINQQSRKE